MFSSACNYLVISVNLITLGSHYLMYGEIIPNQKVLYWIKITNMRLERLRQIGDPTESLNIVINLRKHTER